jgi:endonuclease/exonuclease/phosphatase family metal-dependent hydrolase
MKNSSYPGRGTMYYVRIAVAVAAIIALIYFCSSQPGQSETGNGEGEPPTRTPRPIPTQTPKPTPTVLSPEQITATASVLTAHEGAVRFMTYNVQDGGGDRLPLITTILKTYNADILAIQEANGWQANDSAILDQMAADLGMEYVYCQADPAFVDENGNTEDLVLFSRYSILDSETHADVSHCLLRAQILVSDSTTIQVFATHLAPNFAEVGCQNVQKIADAIQPFAGEQAALIGDFNMPPPTVKMGYPVEQTECPPLLEATGWKYLGSVSDVAQMWVTDTTDAIENSQLPGPTKGVLIPRNDMIAASVYLPLAVDFELP